MLRGVDTERSECVWIPYIVTWSGPAHRSQASLRGAATRGRKTALGGLRCSDPPGATMWVIHTLALNEVNGVTREPYLGASDGYALQQRKKIVCFEAVLLIPVSYNRSRD